MYLPPHFAVTDSETLHQLIRAYPLGALITHGEGGWMPTTCRSNSMLEKGNMASCVPMWPATIRSGRK